MDQEKIEEELGKIVQSLDKGVHLETVLQEEGGWVAILSKGSHSDRANLSQDLLDGFFFFPSDPQWNLIRVYVASQSVSKVRNI